MPSHLFGSRLIKMAQVTKIFIRESETIPGSMVKLEVVSDKYEPTYPYDPSVRIHKPIVDVHVIHPDEGYAQITGDLSSGASLSLDLVNGYLYSVSRYLKIRITKEWKSYGIRIGQANSEVTPQDLLHRVNPPSQPPSTPKNAPAKSPAHHMQWFPFCF